MTQTIATVSLPADQQELAAGGIRIVHRIRSQQTGGAWSLLEYTAPPRFAGPPPHYHKVLEETFYVVAGTLSLQAGTEWIEAPAGSTVVVPPGTAHKFANNTDEPVRFLLLMHPGGFEDYFEAVIELRRQEPVWPPVDASRLQQLMAQYDTFDAAP